MMVRLLLLLFLGLQSGLLMAQVAVPEVPPSPEEVMAIPESLRTAFRKEVLETTRIPEVRLERLVKFVFDERGLGITCKSNATQTIDEVFQTRTVNCLSSTLLVIALAREAGLAAHGQRVDSILAWEAKGGVAIQVQHVNALVDVAAGRRFVVDVDASDVIATGVLRQVGDEQLLAYFYGNRAMELLVDGDAQGAKAWMRVALQHAPADASLLNNAGVLALQAGDAAEAEHLYLRAAAAEPQQISVLANLVSLYQGQGDQRRAEHWRDRSGRVLRKAPYYQFQLGRQQELAGDVHGAERYYRRAIRLNRDEHRFHFALARLYFNTGELDRADRELSIAFDLSEGATRQRYQGKLAVLRQMRH